MAIEAINSKKAPEEEGITSEILQRAYKQFPNLIYTLYNQCLRQGLLSEDMEKGQGNTNHEAWKRRHNVSIKIQTNKLNKWREGFENF